MIMENKNGKIPDEERQVKFMIKKSKWKKLAIFLAREDMKIKEFFEKVVDKCIEGMTL